MWYLNFIPIREMMQGHFFHKIHNFPSKHAPNLFPNHFISTHCSPNINTFTIKTPHTQKKIKNNLVMFWLGFSVVKILRKWLPAITKVWWVKRYYQTIFEQMNFTIISFQWPFFTFFYLVNSFNHINMYWFTGYKWKVWFRHFFYQ